MVKSPPTKQEMQVRALGREDPPEKEMATSSILAWEMPWTKEPGEQRSVESQRVGHNLAINNNNLMRERGAAVPHGPRERLALY